MCLETDRCGFKSFLYCCLTLDILLNFCDSSVIFEIASKYFILDSFVDHDGYSISSKGVLPTVVDIMVI